jgi:hypothetical protein
MILPQSVFIRPSVVKYSRVCPLRLCRSLCSFAANPFPFSVDSPSFAAKSTSALYIPPESDYVPPMSLDILILTVVAAVWLAWGPVVRWIKSGADQRKRRRNYGRVTSRAARRPLATFSVKTSRA